MLAFQQGNPGRHPMSSQVSNIGDLWQRAAVAARRIAGARGAGEAVSAIAGRHIAVLAADGVDLGQLDALYIPGGDESVCTLCDDDEALRFVRETFRHGKSIAASGDGVQVLRVAGLPLPDDARQAMLSGLVVELPRAGLGAMSAAFVAAIAQRRHWQRAPLGSALHA